MKAILKDIDLSSTIGFKEFAPQRPEAFSIFITASIGNETEGADLFEIQVCTPEYLKEQISLKGALWGRHMLIVNRYDPLAIETKIKAYLDDCNGKDWPEVAVRVSRIGHWEFEDYQPYKKD